MKMLQLNARGFAHHFLIAGVIVLVAVGGTYYMVKSKADSCGTSSPTGGMTSAPTSGPCTPTSGPVSGPVKIPDLSCTIFNIPATVAKGTTIMPGVVFFNNKAQPVTFKTKQPVLRFNNDTAYKFPALTVKDVPSNSSMYQSVGSYQIPVSSKSSRAKLHIVSADGSYKCTKSFKISS